MIVPEFKFALTEGLGNEYLPRKGTPLATGWDVRAALSSSQSLKAGQYIKIPLGFRVFAPAGFWLELRPRSSSFIKKQLHSLYGVIDQDYRGLVSYCAQYIPDASSLCGDLVINPGDAIGQIIPVIRQEMDVVAISNEEFDLLCEKQGTFRNSAGFGTTGA